VYNSKKLSLDDSYLTPLKRNELEYIGEEKENKVGDKRMDDVTVIVS